MWSIQAKGYYSMLKRKILIPAAIWMNSEDMILSEREACHKRQILPDPTHRRSLEDLKP